MDKTITVIKRAVDGQETWRYSGNLLEQGEGYIRLEAFFDRDDLNLHGMPLRRGDRFVETWYTDRWYNIFEIHSQPDDLLRGWYCNIGRPAEYQNGHLSYIDLALDLLVFPDGNQLVLDEAEFAALDLPDEDRERAKEALAELQARFRREQLQR
jgi:hypothetical protein